MYRAISSERPVCIFDSGIGGLNLLNACAKLLPDIDFVYFADNFNVPYGNLPPQRIRELVFDIFDDIAKLDPLAAVVACNTVTATCIADLREKYSFPIVGIQPAIKQAVKAGGKCLVLATPATVNSPSFLALCHAYGEGRVEAVACPRLAAYIEDNIYSYPGFDLSGLLPAFRPSSVVLGCTHYVFASSTISRFYSCPIFDGILGTADHLRIILGNFQKNSYHKQKITFFGGDFKKNRQIYDIISVKNN